MGNFIKSGGTASQFLKANGSIDSNSYMLSSSNKINIADTRSAAMAPTSFSAYSLTATFTNQDGANGSDWSSILTVKGWHDGYNTWQLGCGSSTGVAETLKFRAGISSWGSWKTIAFTDSTVAIANKLGTATIGSATLPMYLNAGTPTACTASSVFGGLAMSGDNLSITVAGQNRTLGISYAIEALRLRGTAVSSVTETPGAGQFRYYYNVNTGTSGLFTVSNNANGILTVNTHNGNYYHQLGFSSNGCLYHRAFNNVALNTTNGWNAIAFTSSTVAVANKLGTATVGSATLPIYLNAGTATACTAASIFSALTTSGNNISITIAGQNRTLTVPFATSATNTTNVIVNYHTGNNINYPLVWTNQTANSTATANQLYKSNNFYINPSTGTITATTFAGSLSGTASKASMLDVNSALTYGASGLQYFNINGTAGTTANANNTPTSGWYHIIRMNHANSTGYYADLAASLNHSSGMYWRYISNGSNNGWYKILDSNNYSTYCAPVSHTHDYAAKSHTHSEYLLKAGDSATGTITAPKFISMGGCYWRKVNGTTECPVPTLVYRGRWATGDTSIRVAYQDPFSLHSGFTYSSSTGKLTLTHTTFKTKVGVGFDSTNLMIHVWPYGSKRYALTYDRAETKFSVDSRSGGDNANTEFILEIFIIT